MAWPSASPSAADRLHQRAASAAYNAFESAPRRTPERCRLAHLYVEAEKALEGYCVANGLEEPVDSLPELVA